MAAPTSADTRERFLQEWLARTIATYPEQTGRFLRSERDPFRNPVGDALRVGLGDLAEELFGSFDRARVAAALDRVVRIRAVQEFPPAQVAGFVALARDALRHAEAGAVPGQGGPGAIERRIDELDALAAVLHERCREQIRGIQARAARRRVFVIERMQARAAGGAGTPRHRPYDVRGKA